MISIIVPIYNVEPYLRRCVDSLLRQTYEDFELILVDDGSPDGCGAICDAYAAADYRVRVIHKPNGGLSDARNAGMEMAEGQYIAFVDSDDWVAPEYLARLLAALEGSNADICECDVFRTEGENPASAAAQSPREVFHTAAALEQLVHDGVFRQHVWNKLYRREVINHICFPKGKTNEDEFWTYQVFGNAKRVVKIRDVLYFYFQRPGSIMGQSYSLKRLDALEAKVQRQKYLDAAFPELSLQARRNLFGSCIYAGQMSLLHLKGAQRSTAKATIRNVVRQCGISWRDCIGVSGSNKLWFTLAKLTFWGTCWVKNRLKKGF